MCTCVDTCSSSQTPCIYCVYIEFSTSVLSSPPPPPHQIVTVSEDDENTDAFKAAQVNIGMFGVLTEVTVKVDHAFNLEEFRTHTTLDDCLEHFKDLVEDSGFQYVKFWVELYNNLCVVYRTRRTTLSVKDPPSDLLAFLTVSNCSTVRCA